MKSTADISEQGGIVLSVLVMALSLLGCLSCSGPVFAAINVVADYHFDECTLTGSGYEIADYKGTNHALAVGGMTTAEGGAVVRYGNFRQLGQSFKPKSPIPLGNSWSISVWFKLPFVSTQRYHVLAAVNGGGDLLFLDRDNNYRWGVYTPFAGDRSGTYSFGGLANGWHHLALVGAYGRTVLYIDGDPKDLVYLQATGDLAYLATSYDYYGTVDAQGFGTGLDEFLILSGELSPAEIRQLYSYQRAALNYDGSKRSAGSCGELVAVAEYRLDECSWNGTTGEVKDSSGNSLHGTAVLSPVSLNVNGEAGGVCRAASMGGISHLAAPDNNLLDIRDNLTVMAWVRPDLLPPSGTIKSILSKDTNYEFHINPSGEIYWWWQSAGVAYTLTTSSAHLQIGSWYHIAIRFQAGTATIFVNGLPSLNRTGYPPLLDTNADPLQIGGDYIGDRYFAGVIDEVLVFHSALEDTQILGVYQAQQNNQNYDATTRVCVDCDDLEDTVVLSTAASGGKLGQPALTVANGDLVQYTSSSNIAVLLAQPAGAHSTDNNEVDAAYISETGDIYFSTAATLIDSSGTVIAQPNDILKYTYASEEISLYFKGSDHFTAGGTNIDALHILANNVLLISTSDGGTIGGLGFADEDLVAYNPATRSATLYFDGSAHFADDEDIDGVTVVSDSFLLLSTESDGRLGALSFRAGDIVLYAPVPKVGTLLFIGSDEFDTTQNIDAVALGNIDAIIDHYEIRHDGIALTCNPEDIGVAACLNSDCSLLSPLRSVATMTPTGWVGGDGISFIGTTALELRHNVPETVTLGMTDTIPSTLHGYKCVNAFGGPAVSCELKFFTAGFAFSVPTLTSNKISDPITISAVRSDDTSVRCVPAFTNRTETLQFWSSYISPDSGTMSLTVDGIAVAAASPGTDITLTFDANGQSTFSVRYADAGQMELNAGYLGIDEEAGLEMVGNSSFVAHPAGLCVESGDANSECASGDGSCSAFVAAGKPFNLTLRGMAWERDGEVDAEFCSGNAVTPNYRQGEIVVTHNVIAPETGEAGAVGVAKAEITTGGEVNIEQTVSEVGVFTFTADPPADYLGAGDVFGGATYASTQIGRFFPDHFSVTIHPDPPSFADSNMTFTYLGQPFNWDGVPLVSITAMNGADPSLQTVNYEGSFFKLEQTLGYNYSDDNVPAIVSPLTPVTSSQLFGDINDCNGTVDIALLEDDLIPGNGVREGFTYVRPAPAVPVSPFSPLVRLTVPASELTDSDGVCFKGTFGCVSFVANNISGSHLRHGRSLAENVFGPETSPLDMPFSVYWYDGIGWQQNSDDSVSPLSYTVAASGVTVTAAPASPLTVTNGMTRLTLRPSSGAGTATVTVDAPSWLEPDPSAVATFGIARGNDRLLNWQEVVR